VFVIDYRLEIKAIVRFKPCSFFSQKSGNNETNIVIIENFKKHFENILVNSVSQLTQIRKMRFNKGVFATVDHLSQNYEINVNLVKPNFV
jgi:chemotaxis signal transduction protein